MKPYMLYIASLASCLCAACTTDSDTFADVEELETAPQYLEIETTVNETRSIKTAFSTYDLIGVFVREADSEDFLYTNVCARYNDDGKWELLERILLDAKQYVISAYYPYTSDNSAYGDSVVVENISNSDPTYIRDYLYGSCEGVTNTNPKAKIQFNHVLSRVTITLQNPTSETISLSKYTIESDSIFSQDGTYLGHCGPCFAKGWLNMKSGVVTHAADSAKTYSVTTVTTLSAGQSHTIDLLVFPFTQSGNSPTTRGGLRCFMQSPQTYRSFSIQPDNNQPWERGEQYTYPILLTAMNRCVVPEKIDMGQGIYWANLNLGAVSPSEYGGLYGWADPTALKTSTNYRDYPTETPPSDISGTAYDLAHVMLGEKWRLPTESEAKALINNCTLRWTTSGLFMTSKTNGNELFFPYAPVRIGNEISPYDYGTNYWTSTSKSDWLHDYPAYCLEIVNDQNIGIKYVDVATTPRWFGVPIRPVSDQ
jgi:hypothetical protein